MCVLCIMCVLCVYHVYYPCMMAVYMFFFMRLWA